MSSISMDMQDLVKIHQRFPKILSGNENVTDRKTDRRMDNLKTVYPHTLYAGGDKEV